MSAVPSVTKLASLLFLNGPLAGNTVPITRPITTIGRNLDNDLVIAGDPTVSRHHARLVCEQGAWRIENLSQNNTITINHQQVQSAILDHQSKVVLGSGTILLFMLPPPSPKPTDDAASFAAASDMPPLALAGAVTPPAQRVGQTLYDGSGSWGTLPPAPPFQRAAMMLPSGASPVMVAPPLEFKEPSEQTMVAAPSSLGIPSLEVSSAPTGQRGAYPLDAQVITIGRDVANDIVIHDQSVSDRHLQIVREGQHFILLHPHPERPQTANGLLYQGRKIRGDESYRKVLVNGDVFRIADERGSLITLTYHDGNDKPQELVPTMRPIKLGAAEVTLGRLPDNSVVLPHPQVSGHHARLVREGGSYRILDLNSTNHVYVNTQLATSHLLKLGDEIRIGPYRLVYESTQLAQYDESSFIRLDALGLKKTGAKGATLLNTISLSIPARSFVALVGGSGAGKSTLLDALAGLRPAEQGKVFYNGRDLYENLAAFNTQIGYVPQDDIVHRDLTVERALYYAAKMRLPGDFTRAQIQQRISEVLEDVELTERRGQLIKRLSGGQRKRVSIALELLANPSVFFLDEPTSGLDPGLDRKMMLLLRKLADKGHTVILVTHATNNINVCDAVCFLAPGGRLAYFGPPDQAKEYFRQTDFAEIYSCLEPTEQNPTISEEAEAHFKVSRDYQQYIAQPLREAASHLVAASKTRLSRRSKRGNPFKQFSLLSQRHLELLKNDLPTLLILLAQTPVMAVLLMLLIHFELGAGIFDGNNIVQCLPQIRTSSGVLALPNASPPGGLVPCDRVVAFLSSDAAGMAYARAQGGVNQALQDFVVAGQHGDAQRAVFMVVLIAVLFGCINGAREFVKEAAIYRRERAVNLGILPYMLSKVLVFSLLALFQSAALVLIVNAFEPLHQGVFLPVLLESYLTLSFTSIAGVLLGLLISAIAPNEDTANGLLPLIVILQVTFSGDIVPLKDAVTKIGAMILPIRWGMAAFGSSLGLHSDKINGDQLFGDDYLYHGTLFSTYSQSDATQRILLCWLALGTSIVVLGLLVGLALKRKDRANS